MAIVYINNSSRRVSNVSQEDMGKRWEEGLGKPTGAVCNECGKKSSDGRLVKGLCWDCRNNGVLSDTRENGESSGSYQHDY